MASEHQPKSYRAIMVSSTFTDLEAHRQEVIDAIHGFDFKSNVMEANGARVDGDVIDSSLDLVRHSAAYVAVIGHKYGQTPVDKARNPARLSITELEFNEAQRLGLPTLLFVMSDDHEVKPAGFEPSAAKRKKLKTFIDSAKKARAGSGVERVYAVFSSKEDFTKKATTAIGRLAINFLKREHVEVLAARGGTDGTAAAISTTALHAEFDRIVAMDPDATAEQIFEFVRQNIADRDRQIGELQAIAATDNRIRSFQSAAEEALRANDDPAVIAALEQAEAVLGERRAEDTRSSAHLASLRAEASLRLFDWQAADTAWRNAETILLPFDLAEAEHLTWNAADLLKSHGDTFGVRDATDAAIERWRALLSAATARGDPERVAAIANNLGNSLQTQGERTNGSVGLELLTDAIAAYHDSLAVRTEKAMPAEWAMTQNNLGSALEKKGERTAGEAGLALLADSVAAYRSALTVRTEAEMPVQWAMTQNNLGNALGTLGERTNDDAGVELLADAVTAYRAALSVRTEEAMPNEWSATQNNLGTALASQGERTGGAAGLALLADALAAYRAALTVRDEAEMPIQWAMSQENLALCFESIASLHEEPLASLRESETAVVNSLRVYTPEHMSYYHEKAMRSLTRVRKKIAALTT